MIRLTRHLVAGVARADEPALGECHKRVHARLSTRYARALIEWPRWPLALLASVALAMLAASPVLAQQPTRLRGTIEKVDGNTLALKGRDGAALTLTLTGNPTIVSVVKASLADIKEGSFIGSGAMPQADGTQKALEVHIFAESQRGTGEGHRPWNGAPNSTMTNGTVGAAVTNVEGGTLTLRYKDGEKKIVVGPDVPIVRYEIGGLGDLKPGASFTVISATKKPDGTFEAGRINVGRDGVVPQ